MDHGLAFATDGRCLVVTECEMEQADHVRRAIIPTRIAKKGFATKPTDIVVPRIYLAEQKEGDHPKVELIDRDFDRTTALEVDGKFPNIEHVVPDLEGYTTKISINAKLLAKIVKSMNAEKINILTNGIEGDPLVVLPSENIEHTFGILMPLKGEIDVSRNRPIKKLIKLKRSALEKELQEKGKQQ